MNETNFQTQLSLNLGIYWKGDINKEMAGVGILYQLKSQSIMLPPAK